MCHKTGIAFVQSALAEKDARGKAVLEVGALDVNGSVRPTVEALAPASYLGVDIEQGPGVDEVCDVTHLVDRYGSDAFDVVIASELVEHVRDWRSAFAQMKTVLRPDGVLIITTRSRGFKIHGYPYDYWRYEPEDMRVIFSDFTVDAVETDVEAPGVFVKATKPPGWQSASLDAHALYSVVTGKRCTQVTGASDALFRLRYHAHQLCRRLLPEQIRAPLKRLLRIRDY